MHVCVFAKCGIYCYLDVKKLTVELHFGIRMEGMRKKYAFVCGAHYKQTAIKT